MKEAPRFIPEREWEGERCFILCGGESLQAQRPLLPKLKGRIIAVKQTAMLRPDADVMFVAARDDPRTCAMIFPLYKGPRVICRTAYDGFPPGTLYMRRTKETGRLCKEPGILAGLDAGTSALNLAYQFGAKEIILLGYDMRGGRWLNGELPHHLPYPPQAHFDRHTAAVTTMADDLVAEGVKVWNASPISAVRCFEKRALEQFL